MTSLFVSNIAFSVDSNALKNAFVAFNSVDARIITDKRFNRSRGYGFVEFASLTDAEAAKNALDGKEIDGRAVKVAFVTNRDGQVAGNQQDKPRAPRRNANTATQEDNAAGPQANKEGRGNRNNNNRQRGEANAPVNGGRPRGGSNSGNNRSPNTTRPATTDAEGKPRNPRRNNEGRRRGGEQASQETTTATEVVAPTDKKVNVNAQLQSAPVKATVTSQWSGSVIVNRWQPVKPKTAPVNANANTSNNTNATTDNTAPAPKPKAPRAPRNPKAAPQTKVPDTTNPPTSTPNSNAPANGGNRVHKPRKNVAPNTTAPQAQEKKNENVSNK